MTSEQQFWLALAQIFVPVLTLVGTVALAYIKLQEKIAENSRKTDAVGVKADALHEKTDHLTVKTAELEDNVNGKMARLLEEKDERIAMAERVGKAEGKADVLEKNAAPNVLPVVVPTAPARDPGARTRKDDLQPPPASPPPEKDAGSHLAGC